jgi:hypothetical protein
MIEEVLEKGPVRYREMPFLNMNGNILSGFF